MRWACPLARTGGMKVCTVLANRKGSVWGPMLVRENDIKMDVEEWLWKRVTSSRQRAKMYFCVLARSVNHRSLFTLSRKTYESGLHHGGSFFGCRRDRSQSGVHKSRATKFGTVALDIFIEQSAVFPCMQECVSVRMYSAGSTRQRLPRSFPNFRFSMWKLLHFALLASRIWRLSLDFL